MFSTRTPRGATLLELTIVVMLIGILAGIAGLPLGAARNAFAATAARDALASAIARTRAVAVAGGGARLVIDFSADRCWIETGLGGGPVERLDLAAEYGVDLVASAGGGDRPATIHFDALGIGRMTSMTLRFRRGHAEAGLTISAYGRARPL